MPKNMIRGNTITVNKKYTTLESLTCKDFYWHIINVTKHIPTSISKWTAHYQGFRSAESSVWPRIFKIPFKTVRDTKIQTFQFRVLHRIIPCNYWLHNIKIKERNTCDYCNNVDDLPHFFLQCPKVTDFWEYWIHWWENISGIKIENSSVLSECIIFGFPNDSDVIQVLNYCVLYAKYYIYIQRLYNNKLDLFACLSQLKIAMEMEYNICKSQNKEKKFEKFNFVYEKL